MTAATLLSKIFDHLCNHSRRYLFSLLVAFLIFGLWPFNFKEKNNAVISPTGGLEIARHGTAYTALPAGKLQDLNQFAILIDLTASSDGLNAFEKIFSYFVNQEEMNFLLGQWKDGLTLHLRTDKQIKGIKIGSEEALIKEKRARCLITYDGAKLILYQDGKVKRYRETGPLNFSNWDRTYPLVVGTDGNGRSQWKGVLYEAAIFDRALTSDEVMRLSSPSSLSGLSGQENPPLSPFVKGGKEKSETADGILRQAQDDKPLLHYVFNQENAYETEIRGKKAVGVRDLGKGEPADLVIPEHFMPYQRVYLGWDPDWMKRSSDWLDVAVNILGFIPFGALLLLVLGNGKNGLSGRKEEKSKGEIAAGLKPLAMTGSYAAGMDTTSLRGSIVAVILVVVVGFVVSFAIEYLQAYLPSRDSSLRDLVTNTLGTAMGAVAAALLLRSRNWLIR